MKHQFFWSLMREKDFTAKNFGSGKHLSLGQHLVCTKTIRSQLWGRKDAVVYHLKLEWTPRSHPCHLLAPWQSWWHLCHSCQKRVEPFCPESNILICQGHAHGGNSSPFLAEPLCKGISSSCRKNYGSVFTKREGKTLQVISTLNNLGTLSSLVAQYCC